MLLYGIMVTQCIFSETIAVFDIKVGRCSQLNVYMNLYEHQRSGSCIDLWVSLGGSFLTGIFLGVSFQNKLFCNVFLMYSLIKCNLFTIYMLAISLNHLRCYINSTIWLLIFVNTIGCNI